MSVVRQYALPNLRELRTTRSRGRIIITTHEIGGGRAASLLDIREGELDALRAALDDLARGATAATGGQ